MMRILVIIGVATLLSGCEFMINMPSLIQQSEPTYRDPYVNKGVVYTACGGRVAVVNDSSMKVQVYRDDYAPNADIVRNGIPFEHLVVNGYDQYGQLAGIVEKTFLCTPRGMVEQWHLSDPMLWWQLRQ